MGVAADERRELSDLFEQVGPDAPTLCGDWSTRELAAHLVVRERRADAAAGILVKPLAGHLERVQEDYATKPWPELVGLVRSGPPWFWPTRLGPVDDLVNTAEFFVHHEDVRRARPDWEPREPEPRRDRALWRSVVRSANLMLRGSPVGLVLSTPSGRSSTVKRGPDTVTITGEPGELLLFVFGRDVARVSFEGDQPAIARVRGLNRGI